MIARFKQSETAGVKTRVYLHLVDATDGITAEAGEAGGQPVISKNGAAFASTSNTLTAVDASKGLYYVELTASELDTLGFFAIHYKSADTAIFQTIGQVSYDDPYASHGGFGISGGGSSSRGGLTKDQAAALIKAIKQAVKDELANIKPQDIAMPVIPDHSDKLDKILECVENMEVDMNPIMEAINNLPTPQDYSKDLAKLMKEVEKFSGIHKLDVKGFAKAVKEFQVKMETATDDINNSLEDVESVKEGFVELQKMVDEFRDKFDEQTDMDRRFGTLMGKMKDEKLAEIVDKMNKLAVEMVNMKMDLLEQLTTTK